MSPDDYLKMIKGCIDAGGIAIVSFQIADSHLNRQPAWHMLSLIRRDGDNFTAWDREIDEDFAETGRLRHMMEEVRGDARAGRLAKFRDRPPIRNFERAHSRLMILRINCPAWRRRNVKFD